MEARSQISNSIRIDLEIFILQDASFLAVLRKCVQLYTVYTACGGGVVAANANL